MSVHVHVLFFAGAADAAGCRRLEEALPPGTTLAGLAGRLRERFPRLRPLLEVALWAVNEEYAHPARALQEGDEVALIPPVSGGSGAASAGPAAEAAPESSPAVPFARVTTEEIKVDAVLERVAHPGAGAVVLFLGTVRRRTGDRLTRAIDYEAYVPMAEKQMEEVARETLARWPAARVAAVHRVGRLPVGAVSVAVAASAPHRAEAFAAGRFAIDRIKELVPIWKREIAPDGSARWVHCCADHGAAGAQGEEGRADGPGGGHAL